MVDNVLSIALCESIKGSKKYDGYFEDEHSALIQHSKEIIILDVGGTKFYILKSIFAMWPKKLIPPYSNNNNTRNIMSL